MKTVLTALSLMLAPTFSAAEDVLAQWEADPTLVFDAADVDLADLVWKARPIVVFAQSPNDPEFARQMNLLAAGVQDLVERDVMVIVDTDPDARTDARLRLRPRNFMVVLIGKDGQIKQRKPAAWSVREFSRTIDKMPVRQQEMQDRR